MSVEYHGAYIEPKELTEVELKHRVITWDLQAFMRKISMSIYSRRKDNVK